MSARYEHIGRGDAFDDVSSSTPDREISLGTTTVLAIFIGLAVLCGVFFGFGYSIGRKSMLPTLGNVDTRVSAPPTSTAARTEPDVPASDQPPPTTVVKQSATRTVGDADAPGDAGKPPRTSSLAKKPSASSDLASAAARDSTTRVVATPAPDRDSASTHLGDTSRNAPAAKPPAAPGTNAVAVSPAASVAGATGSYVQVAAISHKEDADLLLASLHRRGYTASIRQVPQDNLLHIQIGPLASKKEADAMRQRLLSDGYNAIVK